MSHKVESITELGTFQIAEGPHWDADTQSLYFVDIPEHTIHKYTPSTKQHVSVKMDKLTSFIIPIKGFSDKFVVGMCDEINIITWDGVSSQLTNIKTLAKLDNAITKFNDAKADSLGHLWTGSVASDFDLKTFTPSIGCLYSLGSDHKIKTHAEKLGMSNGIAFSNDMKKLYYIDSGLRTVDQFDYNVHDQSVSNRQILFTFKKHHIEGIPDGLTIDTDGNLWVAIFYDCKVVKIGTAQPETLLDTVDLPDQQVTSVTFGGPGLDELYITTGGFGVTGSDPNKPLRGYLYKVSNLGAKGTAGCRVKI